MQYRYSQSTMIQNHHSHGINNNHNDASTVPLPSTTHHSTPPCTISSLSSSSSLLPTMVVLVSPKLVEPSIDSNRLSMTVHYLPDPYSSGSNNIHGNTSSSTSSPQLRPYFLQPRVRPNSDPSTPKEVYYQICEMTMIDHIMNKSNSNSNSNSSNTTTMKENNNYHSFLIANENNNSDFSTSSSSSSYIVQDGSIYVLTPIDPLFWLLRDSYLPISTITTTTTSMMDIELPPPPQVKPQWQPLIQFLQEYDPMIQKCIHGKQQQQQQQYQHLLNEMSMGTNDNDDDDDDTMILVQFSVEKALVWLHQKQTTVEQHLLSSSSFSQLQKNSHTNSKNTGAFSSGFTVAKENNKTTVSATNMKPTNVENELHYEQELKETLQQQEQQFRLQRKEESIQLVCNYLSLAWQDHFLQYMKIHDPDFASILQAKKDHQQQQQESKSTNKRSKSEVLVMDTTTTTAAAPPITDTKIIPTVDWNMSLTTATSTTTTDTSSTVVAATSSSSKPKKLLQPITAGAKRLLKVNQRGIQSVSSFFSVGAKNKSKNPTKK